MAAEVSVERPGGTQFEIRHGRQHAAVIEVGATLRAYEVAGQPVLDGFAVDAMPDGGRGMPLLPWPNRLEDGRYEFGGTTHQLAIDEIGRNNASHGLTRWLNWTLVSHADEWVELQQVLHPRPGYPFTLALHLTYRLDARGLRVTTRAHNFGSEPLPFGAGQHPYLTVGTPTVDSTLLRIPAQSRLELDEERRLPTGRVLPLDGTEQDFRTPRPIGATVLDECYTDVLRDADGQLRVTLSTPDHGRTATLWMKPPYRYIQVFSGDTLAPARRRQGLAIEPMTCPPNAFRTGIDVITLDPGADLELEWGITAEF